LSVGSSPFMTLLFLGANAAVLPFWGAMLVAPRAALTRRLLQPLWICLPFACAYLLLFLSQLGVLADTLRHPSFDAVVRLLGSPAGANLAWLHYLTGDLFVGRWIFWDSQLRPLSRVSMSVVYLLGLTFCPLALLLYLMLRGGERAQPREPAHG